MTSAILADPTAPIRVVLVGAGHMGAEWARTLDSHPEIDLVGVADLDVDLARKMAESCGPDRTVIGSSVTDVAARTDAHAVVNVTTPGAHLSVNMEALRAGLPVLCEKPIAPTVADAFVSAAAAEASGRLLMTSQSRRYTVPISAFKQQLGSLGDVGLLKTSFYLAPRFGGFREEMKHVLLVDMAIHAFDAARYLLDREPTDVYCEESNPPWSWYAADATATAQFTFEGGVRFLYDGSWCSDGLATSWNGEWRANGAAGSTTWDGESQIVTQLIDDESPRPIVIEQTGAPEYIRGSLQEFIVALRTGEVPSGEIRSNIRSLAMVEAAVLSSETGTRVALAVVLDRALRTARDRPLEQDIRDVFDRWSRSASPWWKG